MLALHTNRSLRIVLIIGVIALAVFFRLWRLNPNPALLQHSPAMPASVPPGLFSDEAMNGNNAHLALNGGGFKLFYRENNGREGLFINIQALSMLVFGHTSFALRVVSALFGVLTVIALFFFVREYTQNYWSALFASFFIATGFWPVLLSRLGFRANMAPFCLTAGLAALYYVYNRASSEDSHAKLVIVSLLGGIVFGLGFHSYIAYRVAPIILIPIFLLFVRKARESHSCVLCLPAIFLLGAFVAALPIGYYFLNHQEDFFGRTTQISIFSLPHPFEELLKNTGKTIGMFYFAGDFNWRQNFAGKPELWWPVAVFFTVGVAVSARKRWWMLFVWFFAMLLPVVISSEGLPHALRSIVMIPPVFAFAGIGLASISEWIRAWLAQSETSYPEAAHIIKRLRVWIAILVCIVLLAIAAETYNTYFQVWAIRPETQDAFSGKLYETGVYIKSMDPQIEKYVVTGEVDSVDLTGRPMAIEPVLFASESYLPDSGAARNIHYIALKNLDSIQCTKECVIFPVDSYQEIASRIRSLNWKASLDQNLADTQGIIAIHVQR